MIELLELNFPAAGKQTKLNLIGRNRHVTRLRASSVHLEAISTDHYRIPILLSTVFQLCCFTGRSEPSGKEG